MTCRPPPVTKWHCAKCGREVVAGVGVSMDPRYATGPCYHGKLTDDIAERVPLLASKDAAEAVIDQRTHARAVKRALRKEIWGQQLSANEAAALQRHRKALAE